MKHRFVPQVFRDKNCFKYFKDIFETLQRWTIHRDVVTKNSREESQIYSFRNSLIERKYHQHSSELIVSSVKPTQEKK